MESKLLAISHFFAGLPASVIRLRWVIFTIVVLGSVFMLQGALTRTNLDMTIDSFIDQDDPAIAALNEFRTQFGSDDSVFLVYRAVDGDVFSARSLGAVQTLTEHLENWQSLDPSQFPSEIGGQAVIFDELRNIRRVQSLANLRIQRTDGDTLRSDRLVPVNIPDDPVELAQIRERAMAQDDFKLAFYSADGEYGALMIQTFFGAQPLEDFVPAIDGESVSLSDSFEAFSFDDSFDLAFDENAVVETIPFQTVDMFSYSVFFTAVRSVYSEQEDVLNFYPVGNPPMMEFVARSMQQMMYLFIGVIAIFVLLLWVLFRSFSAVVWPIVVVAASLLWAWGITAWLGVGMSTMITLTSMLVFAVGLADCVHVLSAYFTCRKQGETHDQALKSAYGKTGLAIFVTTITTMAGVLALSFSDLVPIKVFGVMTAGGVFLAFIFTVTLLPILLSFWHPGGNQANGKLSTRLAHSWHALSTGRQTLCFALWLAFLILTIGLAVGIYVWMVTLLTYVVVNWQERILSSIPALVARNPYTILTIFGFVFVSCLYGTSLIRIDSNVSELTRADSDIRIAYNIVDENMAGAQNMEIMIDTGTVDGLMNPQLLQAVDELQDRILQRYPDQVSRTYSLANIVKDTNQIMNNDDPAFYQIPDSEIMVSQLLYLFNSANPEDRRSLVSDDFSRSHITINAYNAGSYQYQQFFDELSVEIDDVFASLEETFPELQVRVTGSIPLMMRATDEIAHSQYNSLLLALGVISLIMILTLGSVQAGLISIIPNLIPALMTFGIMGLLQIPLDVDTLLIAPMIIGIAVDDTIHFMTHYRVELIKTRNMEQALRSTIDNVGKAVMFTTMVLGLGFAILGFSDYLGMAKVGIFGSMAIFVALLCDLFLLPAMMIVLKPRFGLKDAKMGNVSQEYPA